MFVIFGTLAQVLYSYSFGKHGLNLDVYFTGVLTVGSSALGGFFFIWLCSKFITFNGLKPTGFEGVFRDEYGTNFVFKHPIRLTKFLPDLIAKPLGMNLTPLENDLIAFLAGYKNMPFDIYDPKSVSIYDYCLGMWHQSRRIKGTNPYHHVAALSKHIGLVYVYNAKRKTSPLWQFWIKDKVKYSKRCLFHGGYSSFVLSTMPSFNALDEKTKRSLLSAIRFADVPTRIPSNCDDLTFSLYENTHRAEQRFRKVLNKGNNAKLDPSETDIMQFKQQVKDYFQTSMLELNLNPELPAKQTDGINIGMGDVIVRVPCLIRALSKNLTPDVRTAMDLWDVTPREHGSWKYVLEVLEEHQLLATVLEDQKVTRPINTFIIDNFAIRNAVLLKVENKSFPIVRNFLDKLPEFKSHAFLEKNKEDVINEIKLKSSKIDEFIKSLYA
tara:strand:+ start:2477 stop:3796 length:1320 start_codon:yes stop_codon:yes gene_type:complete